MFISNLSLLLIYIVRHFYHHRVCREICESRRNRYQKPFFLTSITFNVINKTKKILKTEKPDSIVTSGLPKYLKIYGNGGLIVAAKSIFYYFKYTFNTCKKTFVECEVKQCNKLQTDRLAMGCQKLIKSFNYSKNNRSKFVIKDIYRDIICNRDVLVECYHRVSKKSSANTLGIGNETLDSYSNETIDTLRKSLLDHTFKFKPIRKVEIPKSNGKVRILGIPSPRDKVVQKAMLMALEHVYENKIFLNNSHGFRPNRSTHSAIRQITLWTGTR